MRRNIVLPLSLLCFSAPAIAESPISIGVKGGVPITDFFETLHGNNASYFTNTKRYEVGPTVEFHLPLRLSIEVDGLYKRVGYQYNQFSSTSTITANTVANTWEFPALLKWDILPGPVRPFVDAGASFRHISGIRQVQNVEGVLTESSNAVEFNKRNDVGFTAGFGLTFKAGPVRISPELRYVRWGSENFRDPVAALLRTNRNQGDFLLGFTF